LMKTQTYFCAKFGPNAEAQGPAPRKDWR
jgi:hypothetical protein